MNGTTPVSLANTDIFRIESMYINKIGGSGSGADGTITLIDNATGLIIYAQIDPGSAIFERCVHYVSTGKICIITGTLIGTSTIGGTTFRLFMTQEDTNGNLVPRAEYSISLSESSIFLPLGTATNQLASSTIRYYEKEI